jgi:hypothetical protein
MLASLLFPYDDDAPSLLDGWLDELENVGSIARYTVDGATYIQVRKWADHQRIDKPSPSKFPEFVESSREFPEASRKIVQDQGPRKGSRTKDIVPPAEGRQPKYPPEFEEFWKAYPRNANMSKAAALKSWRKVAKQLPPLPDLLKAVAGYKAFVAKEQAKPGKAYTVKHAEGWLSDQRWEPYLETAPVLAASVAKPDWADANPLWSSVKSGMPATIWSSFFAECAWDDSGMSLLAPSSFVRDRIESQFGSQLRSVFGLDFQVMLKAKSAA